MSGYCDICGENICVCRQETNDEKFNVLIDCLPKSPFKDRMNECVSTIRKQRDKSIEQLNKIQSLFNSGDWSVLRGDCLMTLPYYEAEKVAEELQDFLVNLEKP